MTPEQLLPGSLVSLIHLENVHPIVFGSQEAIKRS